MNFIQKKFILKIKAVTTLTEWVFVVFLLDIHLKIKVARTTKPNIKPNTSWIFT